MHIGKVLSPYAMATIPLPSSLFRVRLGKYFKTSRCLALFGIIYEGIRFHYSDL